MYRSTARRLKNLTTWAVSALIAILAGVAATQFFSPSKATSGSAATATATASESASSASGAVTSPATSSATPATVGVTETESHVEVGRDD